VRHHRQDISLQTNTATFLAVMGAATAQMAYSASRAGVLALSPDLGVHLAKRGVRVNALCIGRLCALASSQLTHGSSTGSPSEG
jgi:NAD(P)-dependent dehydrogenase (short-subunit alcohol dehydrogenase family)